MTDEVTSIIEAVSTSLSANEAPPVAPPPDSAPASVDTPATGEPSAPPAEAKAPASAPGAADAPKGDAGKKSPSKAEADAAKATEEAELTAIEKELVAESPTLASGTMSMSRHQAVLTRRKREHEAALAEVQKKYAHYEEPAFADRLKAFQIAEHNPDQFIQILSSIPEYRTRFEALIARAITERTKLAPPAPAPAPVVEEKEPEPDTLLEGGGMGYSTERANQLWAFRLKQAQKAFDEKLAKLEEGVKPIQEERQTREQIAAAYQRQGGILADARQNWPLFKEYEPKIREELSKPGNERMQLDQAYRVVVVAAERADRTRIEAEARKKLTEELNGHAAAPKSFRPGLPAPDLKLEPGADEIESIIRSAARSLG